MRGENKLRVGLSAKRVNLIKGAGPQNLEILDSIRTGFGQFHPPQPALAD